MNYKVTPIYQTACSIDDCNDPAILKVKQNFNYEPSDIANGCSVSLCGRHALLLVKAAYHELHAQMNKD